MDLVTTVTICNFAISVVMMAIAIGIMGFRSRIVGLTKFFDRCLGEWQRLKIDAATATATNRIYRLRQIYQQQLGTLDRLQRLRSLFGVARLLIFKRR
jgi:hypothetical protein